MRPQSKRPPAVWRQLSQALGLAVAAAALAGCESYLDRRDTVTRGAGDAIAFNKATQTIDRWPKASKEDAWQTDGERTRISIDRYRKKLGSDGKPADQIVTPNTAGATTSK